MGRYLYLGYTENNSKNISHILIRVIRETMDNLVIPEECFKGDLDESFYVTLDGMCLIGKYMSENVLYNKQWVETFINDWSPWHDFHGDKDTYMKKEFEYMTDSIKHAYQLLFDQVWFMVLAREKECYAHWI